MDESQIVPDGTYSYGSTILISFKCVLPCKTNRAVKWGDVSHELRKAAHLAEMSRGDSEVMA